MQTAFRYKAEKPPLRTEADGRIMVAESRVPLDTVIGAFNTGSTPEEIVQDFSALSLADTYAVIGHYLRHKHEVDAFIQARDADALVAKAHIEAQFSSNDLRNMIVNRARSLGLR